MIRTEHYRPPHHDRSQDWSAWIDGKEEGAIGRGPTEVAALRDLIEQVVERGGSTAVSAAFPAPAQEEGGPSPQADERIAR